MPSPSGTDSALLETVFVVGDAPAGEEPRYILPTLTFPDWDEMAVHVGMPYLLSALVTSLQPEVVVEAGTYKGHGALAIAHTLHTIKRGHLYTADPIDQGVAGLLERSGFTGSATYIHDTYERMLSDRFKLNSIDLAFIDASGHAADGTMRMRHLLMTMDRLRMGGVIVMDDIGAVDWPFVNVIRTLSQLYLPGMRGVAIYQKRTDLT